jgi:hypothetical protein
MRGVEMNNTGVPVYSEGICYVVPVHKECTADQYVSWDVDCGMPVLTITYCCSWVSSMGTSSVEVI